MGYCFVKGLFIGLGQNSGIAQAIGFVIIEAAVLIASSVMRPWMDKKMNTFNISIAVVNFLNAICLLILTDIFDQVSTDLDPNAIYIDAANFELFVLIVFNSHYWSMVLSELSYGFSTLSPR